MRAVKHIIDWNIQIAKNRRNLRKTNIWIFGEWWGQRCSDNSCALANYIVSNYSDISCYWITSEKTNTSELNPKIKVVLWKTNESENLLKVSGVVIVNQNLQDLSEKFDFSCAGAIIINLWHGIPWKKIGVDAIDTKRFLYRMYQKYVLKLQKFDGLVCPSQSFQDIYEKTFCISKDKLIKTGQPRNLLFYKEKKIQDCNLLVRESLKIGMFSKIIVYLPTFRDYGEEIFSFSNIKNESFTRWLCENDIYIVQKSHEIHKANLGESSHRIINVLDIPAQSLMAAADMLITDYSSCFFDYLILDRPIVHYLYDYDDYKTKGRGLYFEKEDVCCGEIASNEMELMCAIKRSIQNNNINLKLRENRRKKYLTYESESSCNIIVEYIFSLIESRYGSND